MQKSKILKAVIFDWAGTIIDFGSLSTIIAIKKIFNKKNIKISQNQIQKDMGIKKIFHLKKILNKKKVSQQWKKNFKRNANKQDLKKLSEELDYTLLNEVENYRDLTIKAIDQIILYLPKELHPDGRTDFYYGDYLLKEEYQV